MNGGRNVDYKNNMTEIKLGMKGKILKGQHSPRGEVMIEDDTKSTGGYYIYIVSVR